MLIAPATVWAQADAYSRVSFSASQMYDSNLFATPDSGVPQADYISRVGPTLEAGYRSVPIEFDIRYELLAERYLDHHDLNDNLARQDAMVAVRYAPYGRFRASFNAQFVQTQNPSEFNIDSLLSVGRMPSERLMATASAAYNWTDATRVSAGHTFGRDLMSGGFTSTTISSEIGIVRRTGDRSRYRADYQFRQVAFKHGSPVVSHVVTAGRSYSMTPRTILDVAAGPRFTAGRIRPEMTAALSRQVSWGELSIALFRTELTAFGEQGTIDVHRVAVSSTAQVTRRLTLTAMPAFTHSVQADRRAPVYSVDVSSVLAVNHRLSLAVSGRVGRQYGLLSGPTPDVDQSGRDIISSHSLAVKLLLTLPRSAGGDAPGRSPS